MKFSKSLFLAFAGLGLFACSNEDVANNEGVKGDANVVVRIDTGSRALGNHSTSDALAVTGTATVYLETALGQLSRNITLGSGTQVTFEGVRSPGHIWVSVNGYNTEGTTPTPAITLAMANGDSNKGLNAPMFADGGNVATDEQWTLNDHTYTGTLRPEHKVARLEFSGIKHKKTENAGCIFSQITFDGLFLNNIKTSSSATSTSFSSWAEVSGESNVAMPCFDAITDGSDFIKDGDEAVTYPKIADGECYAYNIVGGDAPTLTLCFSGIKLNDEGSYWPGADQTGGGKGYATVKTYKAKGADIKDNPTAFGVSEPAINEDTYYNITKFPAGYVYQVKDLALEDKNIGTTIDGEPVTVTATITIADWKLVNGQVEWNGSEDSSIQE